MHTKCICILSANVLHSSLLHVCVPLQLYQLFKEYAKKYPSLGMTRDEFKDFLINECCVRRIACLFSAVPGPQQGGREGGREGETGLESRNVHVLIHPNYSSCLPRLTET